MKEGRPKVWMVARQLSFKHQLREPCGVNSSFSMHTEYFVVFLGQATLGTPDFSHLPESQKAFVFKEKGVLHVRRCDVNVAAMVRLTSRCAGICSQGREPAGRFWHFNRASNVSGDELRGQGAKALMQ